MIAEENTPSEALDAAVRAWSRYQVKELVGAGGGGFVWRAIDPRIDRQVALKFLRVDDAKLAARLLREAQAQARIDHPNVCKVYDVGSLDGRPYIAMQFCEGKTLDRAELPDVVDRASAGVTAMRSALRRIERHLHALDAGKAWTFVLHDVHGYDLDEVSQITGVSRSAAQSRLVRGRRALHDRIARDPELAGLLREHSLREDS